MPPYQNLNLSFPPAEPVAQKKPFLSYVQPLPTLPATSEIHAPDLGRKKPSCIRAGWMCIGAGLCTFWLFGIGLVFFAIAIVLSVVAMCSDHVKDGFLILCAALGSQLIAVLLFYSMVAGMVSEILRSPL